MAGRRALKRQSKIACIKHQLTDEVVNFAKQLNIQAEWVKSQDIQRQLIDGGFNVLVLAQDSGYAQQPEIIEWLGQQHIALITICHEDTKIEQLYDRINHGEGDCLISPFDLRDFALAVKRCNLVLRLLEVNSHQHERLKKHNRTMKLSNATYEIDLLAGRKLQKSLLPETPFEFKQLKVEHLMLPSLYLSGDIINYHTSVERYLDFCLGDVSGHGSASAFVTMIIRQISDNLVRRKPKVKDYQKLETKFNVFFKLINNYLIYNKIEKHVTAIAGVVDTETNTLYISTAAHIPAPILVKEGSASFLNSTGKPVGIFLNENWEFKKEQFDNAILYCFSDGIFEILPGASDSAKEIFLLRQLEACEPNETSVREALSLNLSEEPVDDISILMIDNRR